MNPQISYSKDQGNRYLIYHFLIILLDFTIICTVEVIYICGPCLAEILYHGLLLHISSQICIHPVMLVV